MTNVQVSSQRISAVQSRKDYRMKVHRTVLNAWA